MVESGASLSPRLRYWSSRRWVPVHPSPGPGERPGSVLVPRLGLGIPQPVYRSVYSTPMPHVQFKLTDTEHAQVMAEALEGESAGLVAKRLLLAKLEDVAATRTPAMTLAQSRAAKMAARKEPPIVMPHVEVDEVPVLGVLPKQ